MIKVGELPSGKAYHQNLQRVKDFVGREYGTPVALLKRDNQTYLAVAAEGRKKPFPSEFGAPILQALSVPLRKLPEIYSINVGTMTANDVALASAFLSFEMRGTLRNNLDLWQGASVQLFYPKQPIALPDQVVGKHLVNVYRGFSYRIRHMESVGLCLSVDVVHLYADTRTLAERMSQGENWRGFISRQFIYEFGPRWFLIQLREVSKHPISESKFPDPKAAGKQTDVYTYTLAQDHTGSNARLEGLKPTDQTLIYNYPGASEQWKAAVTLARLRYQTEEPEVSSLHQLTLLEPDRRVEEIQKAIATHLNDKVRLDNSRIGISSDPLAVPKKIFSIPAQLFGHAKILEALGDNPKRDDIKEMWRKRLTWLRNKEIGPIGNVGIRSHFLLVPLTIAEDEAFTDRIHNDLLTAVRELSPTPYDPNLVVWDDRGKRTVPDFKQALDEPKQLMERAGVSCAVVILPKGLSRRDVGTLRRHIKRFLYPKVRTKCLQADEITGYLELRNSNYVVRDPTYKSYLRFTALDILVTSGYWLWALAEPLHYDLYVGVDVLNHAAGFTFVGAGATLCRFHPSISDQKEKLNAHQMEDELCENIRQMSNRIREKTGTLPRHLIIHRDGRSYDTEIEGLENAVAQLRREGVLAPDVLTGVVEIHKTTAEKIRLFGQLYGRPVNPMIGSYHVFDRESGLLCTTGFPGLLRGTADPLMAKIVYGNLDIEGVLQDIYNLSILAWTKPDGIQGTPITIKLPDDLLESVAANISDEDEIAGSPSETERSAKPNED